MLIKDAVIHKRYTRHISTKCSKCESSGEVHFEASITDSAPSRQRSELAGQKKHSTKQRVEEDKPEVRNLQCT